MSLSTLSKGIPRFIAKPISEEGSNKGSSLEKWQIALLIGSPIVIGAVFYYYYYKRKSTYNENNLIDENKVKVKKGDVKDASDQTTELTDPFNRANHYKAQGNKYFKHGNYDAALKCYTQAIESYPSDKTVELAICYQNRAAVHEFNKNFEAVIKECTEAIKLNKKYTKALTRRAKAYEASGNIKEALNDITAVDILEKFQNQANLLMTDRLLKQQSREKAKEYFKNRSLDMPSRHFIKNYFLSYCRDPLIKDANNVDADKLNSLLKEFETDFNADENIEAKICLLKGTMEILKGNIEAAEKYLELIVKMENIDKDIKVNALIKLGTIKVQEIDVSPDRLEAASKCFEKAIDVDPNNQDIYIHRAQILLLGEKVNDALQDLEKCCDLAPDFPSAVAQRIYVKYRCAVREEDYEKIRDAIRQFEEAVSKFPKSNEVYSLYAQMLMEQGEHLKADKLFLKAAECDPEDANIHVHRGMLAMQARLDFDKARELMEQALKVDYKCPFAYEMLGTIEVQRGDLVKGIEYFDKALEYSSTEMDCAHLFSLRDAAEAQLNAVKLLGISFTATP